MNKLEAAERVLNGTLTVDEFQQGWVATDYTEAVLYLARLRAKRSMDHLWWRTVNGEPLLEAFDTGTAEVHIGPMCADCGYMQCVVCHVVAPGYVAGQACSQKGKHD